MGIKREWSLMQKVEFQAPIIPPHKRNENEARPDPEKTARRRLLEEFAEDRKKVEDLW